MNPKPITKAVFPVAGLGTRFLPATKASPKEMLNVVDKPLIQYAVEEAISAGITEMIFVTGRSKRAIEDHFDKAYELEAELEAKKMDFYSHIQAIDSRTAAGRLSFAIFGAIAEFERCIIRERVMAGLARAKAEGKKLGRPTNVNVNTGVAVKLLREKGASIHSIAKQLRIGVSTTTRLLAA